LDDRPEDGRLVFGIESAKKPCREVDDDDDDDDDDVCDERGVYIEI
jgi:hypothetical protein